MHQKIMSLLVVIKTQQSSNNSLDDSVKYLLTFSLTVTLQWFGFM